MFNSSVYTNPNENLRLRDGGINEGTNENPGDDVYRVTASESLEN